MVMPNGGISMNGLILYGAGKRCRALCKILRWDNATILAIVDSDPANWGKNIEGNQVVNPDRIKEYQEAHICIAVADLYAVKEIRQVLRQVYHYDLKKEIGYHKLILDVYKKNYKIEQRITCQTPDVNKKETIMFDCYDGLGLGGIEAWTIDICEALLKRYKDIFIISDNVTCNMPDSIKRNVISVDINHNEPFSLNTITNLIEAIMNKLPCKIITSKPDGVMLAAYLLKQYYPDMVEIISVIHGGNYRIYEEYMDLKECSDIYIGVSQDIRNDMILKGIKPEKVYSMTCPFPCEPILDRVYTEDAFSPIHIGYAGRMDGMKYSQKRMDLLLRLVEVLERDRIHYNMELAGDGPARKEMEEFVYGNGLHEKVHFSGRLNRSEISDFWKRQDICINLADYEGRSISIIEAMGNGTVPVVTATSGVKEDIMDGTNGYIVPIGDYFATAKRIEYLAAHREKLHTMGKLAHEMVYPKSLMETHLKFWEKILDLQ